MNENRETSSCRIRSFDFNFEQCRDLQQDFWRFYTTDQYFKFEEIRRAIQEFYFDLGVQCCYAVHRFENAKMQEHFTHVEDKFSASFVTSNNHSPAIKLTGKYHQDIDQILTQLHGYRRKVAHEPDHPAHKVIRGMMKIVMNLRGEIRAVIQEHEDTHKFHLMIVWKDWFNRDALVLAYTDHTQKVI
jgi:hypothetical protein